MIKLRSGGKCEYCLEEKRSFKGGPGIWLEAAHIIGRTHRGTRWLIDNGIALCSGCHAAYDQHLPLEHEIRTHLIGEFKYKVLRNWPKVKAADQIFEIELDKLTIELKRLENNNAKEHLSNR